MEIYQNSLETFIIDKQIESFESSINCLTVSGPPSDKSHNMVIYTAASNPSGMSHTEFQTGSQKKLGLLFMIEYGKAALGAYIEDRDPDEQQ